ncbi:ComEC/Rec2 family competence protein, partial [Bombilactobacillus bombi]|uniref:ComEC/Rec2 family competence protein n=1 Tax=Bombilactobacillus bombi TaxID=1303590 RepID=UPI0015E5B96D
MKSLNLNSQFDNRGWYIYWALVLQLAIVIANKSLIWLWSLLILLLFITAYKNQRYFLLVEMIILFILGFFLGQPTKAQIPTATQIIANPDQIKINNDWISGTGKLLDGSKVSFSGSIPAHSVIPDQKVLIKGDFQWQKITAATNIGEFDFQKYYRYQKIYYRGVAKNIQLNAITKKSNILDYLHIIRFRWLNSLKKLPHWLRVNASSLLLGDFDANEADLRQGLTNLGIIHIFSISGLHVYMLVDFIIKITSWARCPRERIDILLLFFLPLFAIIAGSGVGVWRACG